MAKGIETIDDADVRTLYVDGHPQSAVNMLDPHTHVFRYTKYFHVPLLLGEVRKALFIGGGGFSGPRIFSKLGIEVEAVEIDPVIVDIARARFGLDERAMRVHVMDGREYLERAESVCYDLIVLDAFEANKVPLHLLDTGFFRLAKSRMRAGGMLFINLITSTGWNFFKNQLETIRGSFSTVYVFDVDPSSHADRNVLIVATDAPQVPLEEMLIRNTRGDAGIDLTEELGKLVQSLSGTKSDR